MDKTGEWPASPEAEGLASSECVSLTPMGARQMHGLLSQNTLVQKEASRAETIAATCRTALSTRRDD